MWIQILLIVGVVAIGAFFMRRTGADSHLAIRRLLFGVFVLAAVLSILFPQWLTWVANLIGVGRGTDLLLYALILMFLVFVYTQSRRNAAQQRRLTLLARKLALLQASGSEPADASEKAPSEGPESGSGR
jgi:small membrane protein